MKHKLSVRLTVTAVLAAAFASTALSQETLKIGVMDDMVGYASELGGPGTAVAVEMAVDDFGGSVNGKTIELTRADHQNKPETAGSIAAKMFDVEQVQAIVVGGASSAALSIVETVKDRPSKTLLVSGSNAPEVTGKSCTANTVQFASGNYSLAAPVAKLLSDQGLLDWYTMVIDYSAGHAAGETAKVIVEAAGGTMHGADSLPPETTDFSSTLLKAQATGAKVLGIGFSGNQLQNIVRQAREFGITSSGMTLAPLVMFITDTHSMGLELAQGLQLATPFYWDRTDETRAWSQRFFERHKTMPTQMHANAYAATMHYLEAVKAEGSTDATKVVPKMKATPVKSNVYPEGEVREDGAFVRPMYVVKVKTPAETQGEWDYYEVIGEVPAADAFVPLEKTGCALVAAN